MGFHHWTDLSVVVTSTELDLTNGVAIGGVGRLPESAEQKTRG